MRLPQGGRRRNHLSDVHIRQYAVQVVDAGYWTAFERHYDVAFAQAGAPPHGSGVCVAVEKFTGTLRAAAARSFNITLE